MINNSKKIKSVKEIKKLIDEVKLPDYTYRTNFSSAEFLVDFDCGLIVAAKLIKQDDKMVYKFILGTQFVSEKEVTYEEIKMIHSIIDILEENKKFVTSRLKKYTVEEWGKEQEEAKIRREKMLEAFQIMFEEHMRRKYENDYYTKIGD